MGATSSSSASGVHEAWVTTSAVAAEPCASAFDVLVSVFFSLQPEDEIANATSTSQPVKRNEFPFLITKPPRGMAPKEVCTGRRKSCANQRPESSETVWHRGLIVAK